jgi:cob(I)alamin adenosyltransferase
MIKDSQKAFVQVYTGDGKGKTTAAIGLAIRALGSGLSVYLGQFIKGMRYSEISMLEKIKTMLGGDRLTIEQYGRGCFIFREPAAEDCQAAKAGVIRACEILRSSKFDLVILDEINVASHIGLVSTQDIEDILNSRSESVELVLTGRYAPQILLERADLVTEMKSLRHYYECGIQARDGIER